MRSVSLALVLVTALAPSLGAQDVPPCEIPGHVAIAEVHVIRAPGVLSVQTIEDRDVRVTPMGRGQFRVRTSDDAAAIEGRTETAVMITLAAETTFLSVARVAAGTRVEAIEPRTGGFRVDVPVHDGVSLSRVVVRCPELAAATPTDSALDAAGLPHGPGWRARVSRLRMRGAASEESAAVMITLSPEARASVSWTERERRVGWARVEAMLAHAHVTGWVRDTDLTRP